MTLWPTTTNPQGHQATCGLLLLRSPCHRQAGCDHTLPSTSCWLQGQPCTTVQVLAKAKPDHALLSSLRFLAEPDHALLPNTVLLELLHQHTTAIATREQHPCPSAGAEVGFLSEGYSFTNEETKCCFSLSSLIAGTNLTVVCSVV
jgi:hypothetical protein